MLLCCCACACVHVLVFSFSLRRSVARRGAGRERWPGQAGWPGTSRGRAGRLRRHCGRIATEAPADRSGGLVAHGHRLAPEGEEEGVRRPRQRGGGGEQPVEVQGRRSVVLRQLAVVLQVAAGADKDGGEQRGGEHLEARRVYQQVVRRNERHRRVQRQRVGAADDAANHERQHVGDGVLGERDGVGGAWDDVCRELVVEGVRPVQRLGVHQPVRRVVARCVHEHKCDRRERR
mmetsp:Transcript_40986/g.129245  ORF Transcript_40986/g.129245 Transcript_40986/m.129245 type:complete len:233 (+) Transcript_40986:1-699(+)